MNSNFMNYNMNNVTYPDKPNTFLVGGDCVWIIRRFNEVLLSRT